MYLGKVNGINFPGLRFTPHKYAEQIVEIEYWLSVEQIWIYEQFLGGDQEL